MKCISQTIRACALRTSSSVGVMEKYCGCFEAYKSLASQIYRSIGCVVVQTAHYAHTHMRLIHARVLSLSVHRLGSCVLIGTLIIILISCVCLRRLVTSILDPNDANSSSVHSQVVFYFMEALQKPVMTYQASVSMRISTRSTGNGILHEIGCDIGTLPRRSRIPFGIL